VSRIRAYFQPYRQSAGLAWAGLVLFIGGQFLTRAQNVDEGIATLMLVCLLLLAGPALVRLFSKGGNRDRAG